MNYASYCLPVHLIRQFWSPSDFYLFPNLKRWLRWQRFSSNKEAKWETYGYFEDLDKSYYKRGIKILKDRWTKCIELKGDYVKE